MPVEEELRAWTRMLHRAPPSVRADPGLYRAYVLAAGRRIAGEVPRFAGGAERTVAISGEAGYGTYVLAGLGVVGAVVAGMLLWRRFSRSREIVGLDALGAAYVS